MTDPTIVDVTTPGPEDRAVAHALPDPVDGTRRRRRPTGAAPPLPRSIGVSGKLWLFLSVALLIWVPAALAFPEVLRIADRADTAFLRQVARLRTEWLTTVADRVDRLGSGWTLTAIIGGTIILLLVFRRWRHLFVLLGSITVLEILGQILYNNFSRPRPYGVTIIGRWSGFSMPSPPVAVFAAFLIGVAYTLVVPGRPRTIAKWIIGVLVAGFVGSRLYLASDHPSDVIVAVTLGIAIPLVAFRFFTPNSVFPVAYKRGKTAHLDVGGRRGDAIKQAVQDQLGIEVHDVGHIGLAGSGGSTPIRMKVVSPEGEESYLFAKLYAMSHVRSDRWYKLGRTILYGRLEDESSFQSVRRLAEYEDYAARLLHDVGIPTAQSYGIVELTPEREYLLVTEFFDNAQEIGEAPVDDQVIDECLKIVRRLWDAGIADRDIKPANILVVDDRVLLIDVAFAQVRPSPWRQAVDLANMMLVLAVRTDAERVYRRALTYFTRDDIAEAFAAARGVASPSQLRAALKADGRHLIEEFRALGPERRPIALQRWSVRRIALAAGLVIVTVLAVSQVASMLRPAHDIEVSASPTCGTSDVMILIAQSVPSATLLPCVATLPAGFSLEDVHVERGQTKFSLDSDIAGDHAVEVTLAPPSECTLTRAEPVPTDEVGTQRFERPERLVPTLLSTRYYTFPGGCVTYRFQFDRVGTPALIFAADQALAFEKRATLARVVQQRNDLKLCGATVVCPGGDGVVTERSPFGVTGHLLVALAGLALLAVCALIVQDGTVSSPERDVFRAINDLPEGLYPVLWPFQQFGNVLVAFVVGVAIALALRQWWVAVAMFGAVVLKLAGERVVKEIVQRSRPGTSIGEITMRGDVSLGGLSFVSGHAVIVTAVAGLLTPILPARWKWVPWVFVVLNGVTRIYVGAHNPLDVVGGVGLGLLIAGLLNALLVGTGAIRRPAVEPA